MAGGDQPAVGLGQVLSEGVVHRRRLEERLDVAFGGSGVAGEVEHRCGVRNVERGTGTSEDVEHVLTDVGNERVDVDEGLDVAALGGVRDDHPPYECPTSTTGPTVRCARNERRAYSASAATPRSRLEVSAR